MGESNFCSAPEPDVRWTPGSEPSFRGRGSTGVSPFQIRASGSCWSGVRVLQRYAQAALVIDLGLLITLELNSDSKVRAAASLAM